MLFCKKCNFATDKQNCPICGSKKLREVNNDDFCYFTHMSSFAFEMFKTALNEDNIEVAGIPYYPVGISRANAGRASEQKVYVMYKDFEKAREAYMDIFGGKE